MRRHSDLVDRPPTLVQRLVAGSGNPSLVSFALARSHFLDFGLRRQHCSGIMPALFPSHPGVTPDDPMQQERLFLEVEWGRNDGTGAVPTDDASLTRIDVECVDMEPMLPP